MPARPRVHLTAPVPREVAGALEGDFDLVDSPEGADGILVALTAITLVLVVAQAFLWTLA